MLNNNQTAMKIKNMEPVFLGVAPVWRTALRIIQINMAKTRIPKSNRLFWGKRMTSIASSIAETVKRKIRIQYLIDCPVWYRLSLIFSGIDLLRLTRKPTNW